MAREVVAKGRFSGLLKVVLEDTEVLVTRKKENERLVANTDGDSASGWEQNVAQRVALVQKRAWELSLVPVKSLFMNVVMIYMMGGGGIFGFIVLGYAVLSASRVLLGMGKSFDALQAGVSVPVNMILQKAVYLILGCAMLGYFLFQCSRIGLLPVTEVRVGTLPSIVSNKLGHIDYNM
eukprot:Protomagalhaensia_sp_Gyna_25__5694@NODE_810_length_2565_cov_135_815519_g638_i0_p2_GENE_NODE_810_length_2565_cov_135_815519_g638_i0NODE_810_length_2565_cov_135_815519_g638_i0_p2_ORF_typecomplete_len179_score22_40DUF1077/PF06417_12/2_7e23DUF1700/PF08006_11/0_067_NODE_810_length_2565_cov_135_815519_g638_i05931129